MLKNRRVALAGISAAFYLALVAITLYRMWSITDHHIVYVQDDPYIHMALANRIAYGHYGINLSEYSSPSSSVLWPFLLVPTARTAFATYMPLLLNVLSGCLSAVIIAAGVARFRKNHAPTTLAWSILTIAGLTLTSNLVGLTILGMEHSLQVALALACAYGILCVLQGENMPTWCVVCAALAPSVRYEDLALTMAVAVALLALRQRRRALLTVVVAVLPLVTFSLYLHHLGLPMLPLSVMVKGSITGGIRTTAFQSAQHTLLTNLQSAIVDETRWPLVLMLSGLIWYTLKQRDSVRRITLAGISAALVLHLLIGQFGWFFRYEAYIYAFSAFILVALLHEQVQLPPAPWYLLGLFALAVGYVKPIILAAAASKAIYTQQFQMSRFAQNFYTGNVAVNDLGLVSYGVQRSRFVYDTLGLGTPSTVLHRTVAIPDDMARYHIGLVMIYPGSLHGDSWQPIGTMCTNSYITFLQCVNFFSADPAETTLLRSQFQRFKATAPNGVTFKPLNE